MRRITKFTIPLLLAWSLPGHAAPEPLFDAAGLEQFTDGVWYSQRLSHRGMGSVVTVVQGNRVLLNKGYGYADYASRKTVDPDETLFRIASISKPFTWLAAMQLVEQGKLALDADVNDYITAFQIPATYPEPITMRHLMSHNAGFEDLVIDLGRRSASDLLPLGEYLGDNLPERVRPPGVMSSYSNHSTAIAAHVVEAISGLDWSSYIEQRILAPLEMQRTSARHPMADHHRAELATAYRWRNGAWEPHQFLHWMIYPAGMMSTTGGDMARFMLSQLAEGTPLLEPQTHAVMLEPVFRPFPDANAWLHGYYERSLNGVRNYGHGGDLNGYHSELVLIPEHDVGIFVAVNTDPGEQFGGRLVDALIDRYFPIEPPDRSLPAADAHLRQAEYHGTYASLRRNYSDFSKLALLMGYATIGTNGEGYLTFSGTSTKQYVALGDDTFGARYDHETLKFVRDAAGNVTHVHRSGYAASTMDRLAWHDDPQTHQLLFGYLGLVALATFLAAPFFGVRSWRSKGERGALSAGFHAVALILSGGVLFNLYRLVDGLENTGDMIFGIPDRVATSLYSAALLSVVSAAFGVFAGWRILAGGRRYLLERSLTGLFAVASVLYLWLNYYWNVLQFAF